MNLFLLIWLSLHPAIQSRREFPSISKRKMNLHEFICLQKLYCNACKFFHTGLLEDWSAVKELLCFLWCYIWTTLMIKSDCVYRYFIHLCQNILREFVNLHVVGVLKAYFSYNFIWLGYFMNMSTHCLFVF